MIKKNLIIISLVLLSSLLDARVNPFEATTTYNEEKASLIKALEKSKIKRTIELELKTKSIPKPIAKLKPIVKVKKVKMIKKPVEEIIFKEPISIKKEIKTYKYNLLSFIKIDITDDIMNISTRYKITNWFILKDENKIVFDFVGKKRFYTKRETLSSHKDFKKIIIGAHPENDYFRVVIQTQQITPNYKIKFDNQGLITIFKR
jgi:hypothetical protein